MKTHEKVRILTKRWGQQDGNGILLRTLYGSSPAGTGLQGSHPQSSWCPEGSATKAKSAGYRLWVRYADAGPRSGTEDENPGDRQPPALAGSFGLGCCTERSGNRDT